MATLELSADIVVLLLRNLPPDEAARLATVARSWGEAFAKLPQSYWFQAVSSEKGCGWYRPLDPHEAQLFEALSVHKMARRCPSGLGLAWANTDRSHPIHLSVYPINFREIYRLHRMAGMLSQTLASVSVNVTTNFPSYFSLYRPIVLLDTKGSLCLEQNDLFSPDGYHETPDASELKPPQNDSFEIGFASPADVVFVERQSSSALATMMANGGPAPTPAETLKKLSLEDTEALQNVGRLFSQHFRGPHSQTLGYSTKIRVRPGTDHWADALRVVRSHYSELKQRRRRALQQLQQQQPVPLQSSSPVSSKTDITSSVESLDGSDKQEKQEVESLSSSEDLRSPESTLTNQDRFDLVENVPQPLEEDRRVPARRVSDQHRVPSSPKSTRSRLAKKLGLVPEELELFSLDVSLSKLSEDALALAFWWSYGRLRKGAQRCVLWNRPALEGHYNAWWKRIQPSGPNPAVGLRQPTRSEWQAMPLHPDIMPPRNWMQLDKTLKVFEEAIAEFKRKVRQLALDNGRGPPVDVEVELVDDNHYKSRKKEIMRRRQVDELQKSNKNKAVEAIPLENGVDEKEENWKAQMNPVILRFHGYISSTGHFVGVMGMYRDAPSPELACEETEREYTNMDLLYEQDPYDPRMYCAQDDDGSQYEHGNGEDDDDEEEDDSDGNDA